MITHHFATTNSIRMHYAAQGDGPVVLLLHGFPEFWYSWRHQLPALAGAGFKAVAPDLRGYGQSDKPRPVAAYQLGTLLADIDGLRSHLGADQIDIVGHDWGAALAWSYAGYYPHRVRRMAVLNCPHPAAMARHWRRSWGQKRKSWYMGLFQIPWLPEFMTRLARYQNLRAELTKTVNPHAMSPADIEQYIEQIRQPGALTAGMNYYRALVRAGEKATLSIPAAQAPTSIIWGEQDAYLEKGGAELSLQYGPPGTSIYYIPDASHWVQLDQPATVNQLLISHLRGESH